VNLCARCTLDPALPGLVAERLAAHDVPPDRLILEVTEGVMATDLHRAQCAVAALRSVGVQVSVGDFGATLASLEFLARCPVDEVKIDREFVAELIGSPETAAIVAAALDLGRELGLRVVAEGVERPEQRDALSALGVTTAQGYLFYPPMPPQQATTVLQGLAAAASTQRVAPPVARP
jgi:EAL domain-containing protein (putative c-di-GMP-specific phosphodiesterase class I)